MLANDQGTQKGTSVILHRAQYTALGSDPALSSEHAYLFLFGFTLARANARMLINAASKRSSAKNAVRTSRSRST